MRLVPLHQSRRDILRLLGLTVVGCTTSPARPDAATGSPATGFRGTAALAITLGELHGG